MNKTYKLLFSALAIIFIAIIALFLSENTIKSPPKIKVIKHEIADKLYNKVKKEETSDEKKYISKLYGYTSDKNQNITIYTKEGYIKDDMLYDLDNNVIGKYEKTKQNEDLEKATLKTYKFNKNENDYKLREK